MPALVTMTTLCAVCSIGLRSYVRVGKFLAK